MKKRINGETLLELFVHEMKNSENFSFISGTQPFKIKFSSKEYFVYIKNMSSAYFKNRPDVNRAQLPMREEFQYIKESDIPFVFFGYDVDNDVYVCWNYNITKQRLNVQDNVSFYSRQTWQSQVTDGSFLRKQLTNDADLVLFKRKNLIDFFERIDTFFANVGKINSDSSTIVNQKLYKITDAELLEKIKPSLTGQVLHTLEAIQLVQNYYADKYPNMTYKDWSSLVKSISF